MIERDFRWFVANWFVRGVCKTLVCDLWFEQDMHNIKSGVLVEGAMFIQSIIKTARDGAIAVVDKSKSEQ